MPGRGAARPVDHLPGLSDSAVARRDGQFAAAHPRRRRAVLAEGARHRLHQKSANRVATRVRREDPRGE